MKPLIGITMGDPASGRRAFPAFRSCTFIPSAPLKRLFFVRGKVSTAAGEAAFRHGERAIRPVMEGQIDAAVTNALNKGR